MDSISIDRSNWPIVIHTATGSPSNATVDDYMRECTQILARGEPHVTIVDARAVRRATAYGRAQARDWLEANRSALKAHSLGTAYVIRSSSLRFVLMTTLLLARRPTPYRVCETLDEAIAWARERIAESLPSA